MSTPEIVPQSPKKRKVEGESSEKSKKRRRKQAEQTSQEDQSADFAAVQTKEKKRKRSKALQTVPTGDALGQDIDSEEEVHLPTSQTVVEDIPSQESPRQNGEFEDHREEPEVVEEVDESLMTSNEASCFYSKRLSLYVPIPAISLSTSTSSLLSLHLTPLILTYFPPAGGLVLAFSDPVLSARSDAGVNLPLRPPASADIPRNPPDEMFAQCADQFGVCWIWLTATFLVFAPQSGDTFKGWANVQSESFIGLISYNYFQTSVMKSRIPQSWTFTGPSQKQAPKKKSRKAKLNGENDTAGSTGDIHQNPDASEPTPISLLDGVFQDHKGIRVSLTQVIRVHDVDMTPGAERNRYGLQIEGSLLSAEEEKALLLEEKRQYDDARKRKPWSHTPGVEQSSSSMMSGALQ